ncbi:HNH endonuclease [Corynebacterium diphtheriae]|nr:HNH endonuclease [Corynebacterium diphtheriae]CAB0831373.1 HNH endonuclease [Corynebacterium diphtheriae]CAB0937242.1 HNH endonuclease [Corynebacterium diphtheriae]
MAWIRVGDTFNQAKEWTRAAELAIMRKDERLVDELKGVALSLYFQSAVSWSDYEISLGAAAIIIRQSRFDRVIADLKTIGVLSDLPPIDGVPRWKLLERKDFVHIIKEREKLMATKRKRDVNKGSLVVPVLLRDGSTCRYCGIDVNWKDNKNDDGGTFDHRCPEDETTVENFVVCCRGCNQLRGSIPDADMELPLLPAPVDPLYDDDLLKKISRWARVVKQTTKRMGIINPLEPHFAATDLTSSEATTNTNGYVQSEELSTSQVENDPRFPQDSRKDAGRGRVARKACSDSQSKQEHSITQPTSQEPSNSQLERDPLSESPQNAPHGHSANKTHEPARKRRRRRRGKN